MRNVYTAAAPDFKSVRLTSFMEDNGVDMTTACRSPQMDRPRCSCAAARRIVRDGLPIPGHDPDGGDRAIWAVHTTGGAPAIRVAEGQAPTVSPDGKWVLYVKDNQIFRARTTKAAPPTRMDTGGIPFIKLWGSNTPAALVAGRIEDRVRQRARESFVHRLVRREDAEGDVRVAECGLRWQSDVVG